RTARPGPPGNSHRGALLPPRRKLAPQSAAAPHPRRFRAQLRRERLRGLGVLHRGRARECPVGRARGPRRLPRGDRRRALPDGRGERRARDSRLVLAAARPSHRARDRVRLVPRPRCRAHRSHVFPTRAWDGDGHPHHRRPSLVLCGARGRRDPCDGDARGLSPALAAVFFGVPQLVGVVGAPLGGWLSDRFGRRRVMVGGLALMGPAVYAITAVPNDALLPALVVFGLLWSMRSTVTETLVMDSASPGRRATVLGGYYLLNAHVGGIGAPLFGFLAEAVGLANAFSWIGIAFVAMSAVALVVGRRL